MKKALSMIVMLAAGFLLATAVVAEARHLPSSVGMRPRAFIGNVAGIDASNMILVVKNSTSERTFDVSSAQYAGVSRLKDLKKGDRVSIEYVGKYGKYSAVHVAKVRLKPAKGKQ